MGNEKQMQGLEAEALLTPRQRQVLTLLAKGRAYKEIAADLGVSMETVRQHIKDIYRRLGVNSRTQALLKYLRMD